MYLVPTENRKNTDGKLLNADGKIGYADGNSDSSGSCPTFLPHIKGKVEVPGPS
jgi:hypothetical protein